MSLFPTRDWQKYYPTDESIKIDLEIEPVNGWHLKNNDTLLMVSDGLGGWNVYVWNNTDPREYLINLAKLPEFKH